MSGSEKLWYYNQLTYDTIFITVCWPVLVLYLAGGPILNGSTTEFASGS